MNWWVAELLADDPAMLISWVVCVIASIVLHELAHGWAAIRQGDRTPIETGHMTWNPLVHMGWPSLIVFALVGIAWGMMPVNPSRFRSRHGEALVAFAGPAMNLLLAGVCILLAAAWGGYCQAVPDPLWRNLSVFFRTGAFLNLVLAAFNLLPLVPLDGSRILASLSTPYRRLVSHPNAAIVSLILLVLMWSQFGRVIVGPSARLAGEAIRLAQSALPGASPMPQGRR